MTEVRINGFDELIEYLNTSDLNAEQTNQLIQATCKVFFIQQKTKTQLIEALKVYWSKYGHMIERPIFGDIEDGIDIG